MNLEHLVMVPFAEPRGIARRVCTKCGQSKPLSEFARYGKNSLGRRAACKPCMSRFNKRYRIAHNEKRRTARYLPENVEKTRADGRRYEAQRRARKLNGWTDNHSAADLAAYFVEIGAHNCVYCGGPAEHIDHVVPLARGGAHAIGNLLPACAECNKSKGARDPYAFLAARFPGLAPLFAPYIGTLPLVDSFQ